MPSDSGATLDASAFNVSGDIELSKGPAFALAFGAHVSEALRVELEGAYRPSDIDGAKNVRVNSIPVNVGLGGDVDTWSLMINAHYDIAMAAVRPYIGAGLGIARHDGSATLTVPVPGQPPASYPPYSGDDTVFAYQFMAGIGYEISENVSVFGGYRYMGTDDLEIEKLTADYGTHGIEAGLRFGF
jgi:opacity protein-like surface antigen